MAREADDARARWKREQRRGRLGLSRRGAVSLLREAGAATGALVGAFVGVLLISLVGTWLTEEVSEPLERITAVVFSVPWVGAALLLVGGTAGLYLQRVGDGWLGLACGGVPPGYEREQDNLPRALGAVLTLLVAVAVGAWLIPLGVGAQEDHWAVQGVILVLGGLITGGLGAVPRWVFGRRGRGRHDERGRVEQVEREGVLLFVLAAALGLGASLAVSEGAHTLRARAAKAAAAEEARGAGAAPATSPGAERRP